MMNEQAEPNISLQEESDIEDEQITLVNLADRAEVRVKMTDESLVGQIRSVPLQVFDQTTDEVNYGIDLQLSIEAAPVPYFLEPLNKILIEEVSSKSFFEYFDLPQIVNRD